MPLSLATDAVFCRRRRRCQAGGAAAAAAAAAAATCGDSSDPNHRARSCRPPDRHLEMGTSTTHPMSRLKWAAVLMACLAIPLFLFYGKQPGGTGSSDVCFRSSDFEVMFAAKVSHPDPQLSGFLRLQKIHPHYPSFDELLHTIYHTNRSVYSDFTLPTEMPEAPYYPGQTSSLTTDFLAQLHPEPIKFMLEVGGWGAMRMWREDAPNGNCR